MSEIEAKSDTTCCGVLNEGTFRYAGAGWPLDGEVFTEGEQGDDGGARVPKRGEVTDGGARVPKRDEVTATGGPPVQLMITL